MRMITEDTRVSMKDFSAMPIHHADTYLSKEEEKCAIVVLRSSQGLTWRGWGWGGEWQPLSGLSAQNP